MPGYVLVEGMGEVEALPNLLHRLGADLGLPPIRWARPLRQDLYTLDGLRRGCERVRSFRDASALLIVRDSEDDCPATAGPGLAAALAAGSYPFPIAVSLMYREYETLFLASLSSLRGRRLDAGSGTERDGILADAEFVGDPQRIRDAKGWLSAHMPPGRAYKPTTDQLAMTRLITFDLLRERSLPCFETLERALRFLTDPSSSAGQVYPLPPEAP